MPPFPDPVLNGKLVTLRPAVETDVPALAAIRATPQVRARWRGGDDLAAEVRESIADGDLHVLTILLDAREDAREDAEMDAGKGARTDARQGARTDARGDADKGGGRVVGAVQWSAEDDPDYRHASVDIFVDPAVHGRGVGTDAVRALAAYLIDGVGFHRLVIDPAADNAAAIRCYAKVGFEPVGIMRDYERGADGSWHDGLLMDLLATEFLR